VAHRCPHNRQLSWSPKLDICLCEIAGNNHTTSVNLIKPCKVWYTILKHGLHGGYCLLLLGRGRDGTSFEIKVVQVETGNTKTGKMYNRNNMNANMNNALIRANKIFIYSYSWSANMNIAYRSPSERGKPDTVSRAKTVQAVPDFAKASQRFRSRAP
jgi:hypothetical protein